MTNRSIFLVAGLCALVSATEARAQEWIDFSDETSQRLSLTEVSMNDAEEKDIHKADFDQDGWMDLVVVRKQPFSNPGARIDVLLMNEEGTLVDRTAEYAPGFLDTPTDARDVEVADFDDDGWLDIVVANTFNQQPKYYRNLGEDGNGNWQGFVNESSQRFPTIPLNPLQICAVWAGDVTGDGSKDLYFVNYGFGSTTKDTLMINDGNGFFTDESDARLGSLRNSAFGTAVEMDDIDQDGDQDIIKTTTLYSTPPWNDRGVVQMFNDGSGFFDWTGVNYDGADPYMFTARDFDGDEQVDVFVVKDGQDHMNMVTGTTQDADVDYTTSNVSSPRTSGFGGNPKAADIDNDGDLDLGVSPIDVDIQNCGFGSEFALLRNDGTGDMDDPWGSDQGWHEDAHDFSFIDINNDGCLDMFQGLCSGWRVFMQTDCEASLQGDLNGDGIVDGADLGLLLGQWGGDGAGDLNDDGVVDGADLGLLLGAWTG